MDPQLIEAIVLILRVGLPLLQRVISLIENTDFDEILDNLDFTDEDLKKLNEYKKKIKRPSEYFEN